MLRIRPSMLAIQTPVLGSLVTAAHSDVALSPTGSAGQPGAVWASNRSVSWVRLWALMDISPADRRGRRAPAFHIAGGDPRGRLLWNGVQRSASTGRETISRNDPRKRAVAPGSASQTKASAGLACPS